MDIAFSIVIPTCGRQTLEATLRSIIKAGASEDDEVIVVGNGPQPKAKDIVSRYGGKSVPGRLRYFETAPDPYPGHLQRTLGMEHTMGSHLIFIDDDDEYVDDAISKMRGIVSRNPGSLHMFRMISEKMKGKLIWGVKGVLFCNVSTQNIVVPNIKDRFGKWGLRRGGDYDFIRSTTDKWPGKDNDIIWVDEVTVIAH